MPKRSLSLTMIKFGLGVMGTSANLVEEVMKDAPSPRLSKVSMECRLRRFAVRVAILWNVGNSYEKSIYIVPD